MEKISPGKKSRQAITLVISKTKVFRVVLIGLAVLSLPLYAGGGKPAFTYKVVSVLDGDTFVATDGNVTFRVRIAAMDAPEKGQPYGKMARGRLSEMLKSRKVTIQPVEKGYDRYGRVLGRVFFGERDIALVMIEEGLATYYRPFCRDYPEDKKKYNYDPQKYVRAEQEARSAQKNIWSRSAPTLPCQHRRSK